MCICLPKKASDESVPAKGLQRITGIIYSLFSFGRLVIVLLCTAAYQWLKSQLQKQYSHTV